MKKDKLKVGITELFMAQADRDRRFYGTIKRERDDEGNQVVRGRIDINGGFILASAPDQFELGEKLDDFVLLILDHDLHENDCITVINPNMKFDVNRIYIN